MDAPLRFSRLKLMGKSPAHYAAAVEPESSAISIGDAADRLIFKTGAVTYYPGPVRRGKDWEAFRAAQDPAALILTQRECTIALNIAVAVKAHPEAYALLMDGERQQTMHWTFQGRACRGTPDTRGPGRLVDLKTGETADPRRFPWKVKQFAYHAQLSWYQHGAALAGYGRPETAYIVAVEQAPPYVVTVFKLTDDVLEQGERLWRLWFEQLQVCEASNHWPGYAQSPVDLTFPDDESMIELADAVEIADA